MKKKLLRLNALSSCSLKMLVTMKLILFLSTVLAFQINAAVYSQSGKFNLELKGKSIREAILIIEKNSKFKFFYNEDFINVDDLVNIEVIESGVEEVLDKMLVNKNIDYTVLGDELIVLTHKSNKEAQQGSKRIKGSLTDALTGESLAGATVQLKGTNTGVIADIDGAFVIDVNDPATDVLVISMVGYEKTEIAINNASELKLAVKPEVTEMEQVVVIGYGVQKKKDLTGAVAVVDMKEMKKLRSAGVAEALQGQVGGIIVTTSGEPGKMADVKIRGISSLNGGQPLYVIDGLILDNADNLNPNDIESMQVLKDASSAAIYGSRGMNGVIIITTKRGADGPVKVEFTSSYGVDQMPRKLNLLNSQDYLKYNQLSYVNAGVEWPGRPVVGQYIANTDWQKAIFRNGRTRDNNISLSGGNQNGTYMVGLGYYDQDGIIEGPWYKRYSMRVNSSGKKGIFSFGESLSIIKTEQRMTQGGSFGNALTMPPVIPVYDPAESSQRGGFGYGSVSYPTYASNPLAIQRTVEDIRNNYRAIGNIYMQFEPVKGLVFKSNFSADFRDQTIKNMDYGYTRRYLTVETRWQNKLWTAYDQWITLTQEQTLNFNKSFGYQ